MSGLSGAWWEAKPRSMVAEGIRKAAEQISTSSDAPPGMEHYQDDPIGFCVQELGIRRETLVWSSNPGYENHQWDGTPDPIVAWFDALVDWKDVGIESATGTGKSFGLALTKLWFLACWQGARCFDFATKKDQLSEYSWVELGKLWPRFKVRFPSADLSPSGLRIRMDGKLREGEFAGWGAIGQGVQVREAEEIATGAAGMHARDMLISVEEAQGLHHAISAALENTSTSPHNLRQYVGNPDSMDDALHQFCELPSTVSIRISAYDHPNVVVNVARDPEWRDLEADELIIPGAVSRTSILRRLRRYGREHPHFQSRIRGISPPQHAKSLIRQEWLDRAADRWRERAFYYGLPAMGVDAARSENGDKGAIAEGTGAHLEEVINFPCPDPTALGVRVAARMALRDMAESNVGVDTGGGYGGSIVDKLAELDIYVRQLNPGFKPEDRTDYDVLEEKGKGIRQSAIFENLRAQMAWQLAIDLQLDRVALPPDTELHEDLRSMRWETKGGKIRVEAKEKIQERLSRSPDKGEAVINWNWVRERIHEHEETTISAFDREALEATAREGRRLKEPPPLRGRNVNPSILETVE